MVFEVLTVFNVDISFESSKTEVWQGVCLDTEAKTKFIAPNQGKSYWKYMGTKFKASHSNKKYKFGNFR